MDHFNLLTAHNSWLFLYIRQKSHFIDSKRFLLMKITENSWSLLIDTFSIQISRISCSDTLNQLEISSEYCRERWKEGFLFFRQGTEFSRTLHKITQVQCKSENRFAIPKPGPVSNSNGPKHINRYWETRTCRAPSSN